jgi:hypothetical protein
MVQMTRVELRCATYESSCIVASSRRRVVASRVVAVDCWTRLE